MKRLEWLMGRLITSKLWVHVFFWLLFAVLFSFPVVLSGNNNIIQPALCSGLFILTCTYAGRWCGKLWLSGGVVASFVKAFFLSFATLSIVGAVGAALLFKGSIPHYFVEYLVVCIPLVVLFLFFGLSITMVRQSLLKQISEAKLAQEQKESELRLLLSQLSPHFLFNTLNNIYGISLTQHRRVPDLLLKLSELLRYSVYETGEQSIALKNELQYIENYINLEKIQTGQKLRLDLNLANITDSQIQIAPMLLIVFVENAFKHSKITLAPELFITISLQVEGDWINFNIKNSYDSGDHQTSRLNEPSGVGLRHTLKRLELIYGKDYFYKAEKENGMYNVELKLKVMKR